MRKQEFSNSLNDTDSLAYIWKQVKYTDLCEFDSKEMDAISFINIHNVWNESMKY